MCGITGIVSFDEKHSPTAERLKRMVGTLYHRGPDAEGMKIIGEVGLGVRRLSIIDIQGGNQPIANEDGTVHTIFNGEIYNFRDLRNELKALGHGFSTQSDTETIVHAYEEYGAEFPLHLNGMFAIALHDKEKQKVYLARDPIGIKPLYYCCNKDYVVWGSEIKAILASEWVEKELDIDALGEFLAWEYVPGRSTLLRSVRKLEAGSMLEIDVQNRRYVVRDYWDIKPECPDRGMKDSDWEECLRSQIGLSTRRQMVSDVPLGAFLSGGVDSSLVVSAMKETRTYSIGFDDDSYNELKWAKKVADHLGVIHIQEKIKADVAGLFHELVNFLDDPIGDFSIFPTYLVSRLARKDVTVVLSGDGGDELFGGYETYIAENIARIYSCIPALVHTRIIAPLFDSLKPRPSKKGFVNKAKRFLEGMDQPGELGHARWRIFAGNAIRSELFTEEAQKELATPAAQHIQALFRRANEFSPLHRSLYVDTKSYLCDNILAKVDRMSMAVSLETRVPYLDTDLVSLAFRIPDHLKVNRGKTKVLLKRIAAQSIPRECVYRPKEGFSIPIKNWLGMEFRPILEEFLTEAEIKAQGIFDPRTVERLKSEHLSGRENHSHILWSLIVFHAWRKRWLC